MSILKCFSEGLKRVLGTPSLALWIYVAGVILAFPLTAVIRGELKASIGESLVQKSLGQGFDLDWFGEFRSSHGGIANSFGPGVIGILPIMSNLQRLMEGHLFMMDWSVLGAGLLFLLVWAFFGGGIISCYAEPEEPGTGTGILANSARFFPRFARLLVLSLVLYLAVFRWIAGPLHRRLETAVRDVTSEGTVMLYTFLIYALVAVLLMFIGLALDYAKIAMVTENRRSALLGFVRGLQFVLSKPLQTIGLYLLLMLVTGIWIIAYSAIAPGVGQAGNLTMILAFGVGQLFIFGRLFLKFWFLGSQTVLLQSSVVATPAQPLDLPEGEYLA